jgi:amino acid transporter
MSFVVAGVVALLTGLTFAELGSRIPLAGGPAAYCRRAFAHPAIAFIVGFLALASAISSAATVARACVGYLEPLVSVSPELASLWLLGLIAAINFAGIEQSARINLVLTAIEIGGLLLVIGFGGTAALGLSMEEAVSRLSIDGPPVGVFVGAGVAVFAYIGFEDAATIAEEVRDPRRAVPRAMLTAISVTTVVYVVVAIVALLVVPVSELAGSEAPLMAVIDRSGAPVPRVVFSLIALVAVGNTALLNLIMASRLTYGMAREGLVPDVLARVHAGRQTPWVAIASTSILAVVLSVSGSVGILAQTTSLLLLCVFAVLHIALARLQVREPDTEAGVFRTPRWTPPLGLLVCAVLMFQFPLQIYLRTAMFIAVGLLLYRLLGKKTPAERRD